MKVDQLVPITVSGDSAPSIFFAAAESSGRLVALLVSLRVEITHEPTTNALTS